MKQMPRAFVNVQVEMCQNRPRKMFHLCNTMKIRAALILFCLTGCSTFNSNTVYMNKAKGLDLVNYRNDVAELTIQFNPKRCQAQNGDR